MNDSRKDEDTTKPVFSKPPSGGDHRMNELFNRFRSVMIEISGLSLTELKDKERNRALEDEILRDFVNLQRKYKLRN